MNNTLVLRSEGWRVALRRITLAGACILLAACGGGGGGAPIPIPPALAPAIALQPASLSVTEGQAASFSVAAAGDAPLAYQWQRNGTDIAGATATSYTIAATVLADSGAAFRAVVSNAAGIATSNAATLTVIMSAPVLTVTLQPAATSAVAGTSASFSVAATCSAGTLAIQWQRGQTSGGILSWANIAAATTGTYGFATAIGDSGAQFRANLDCSGQSVTPSNAATLTVTAPGSVVLGLLPVVGLRDQAQIPALTDIDQDPAGSFTFITGSRIKRLSADLASITLVAGGPFAGSVDGVAAAASFNQPLGLTHDSAGNVYVADSGNHTIRRIAADGIVSTLAGLAGSSGTVDGTGAAARFSQPSGIAIGPDGDLYVAELESHRIRRVTTSGVVSTYAGSTAGYADGTALAAKFNSPRGVAVAANGDVLVADYSNARIRRIVRNGSVAGAVQTVAGNGSIAVGSPDGIGTAAVIGGPIAMVVRGNTLTVRDYLGLLRQIDLTSTVVTTLTGSRALGEGYSDGSATTARMRSGYGVTTAPGGGFMLADDIALRLVSAAGAVRTIAASNALGTTPAGVGTLAQLPFPLGTGLTQSVAVDAAGNVVIADRISSLVRRISPSGVVTLAAGLTGSFHGSLDGVGSEAQLGRTGAAITVDSSGVLFAADQQSVRRIGTDNATTVWAGSTTEFGEVDGSAITARFNSIGGLAAGPGGNVFVGANNAVRRIDAAGNVSTFAGLMTASGRVDGPVASARFQFVGQLAFAPDGALYVIERGSGVIRRIAPDGLSVSTLVAYSTLTGSLAIDAAGTLYYGTTSGLAMQPAGGAPGVLIAQGLAVVLGANPSLMNVDGLAVLGPKQLVVLSNGQILTVTLP